ncbi:hypothetical protein [Actinoallomurus rhizosphaericola]|uniref:hypothetical protein n=1 Tax=Actinoallomurus rhizosphaericola TaxID=2952536 RepID=UPI0020901B8D|nr:hypothetical protein [Actinoallomurus rhizosphaericola]MCO5992916.1 hypothetical protein [Actinoallomurus rhizosphaericola]
MLIAAMGIVGIAVAIATAFAPARPTTASAAKAAEAGSHRVGVRPVVHPAQWLRRR